MIHQSPSLQVYVYLSVYLIPTGPTGSSPHTLPHPKVTCHFRSLESLALSLRVCPYHSSVKAP